MNTSKLRRLPGILISSLFLLASLLFIVILVRTKIVPGKLLLIIGGVFLLLTLCIFLLTMDTRRVKTMVFGCCLVVFVLAGLMFGTNYLSKAVSTLDSITKVDVEIAEVGIYVRKDDPAQSLSDLQGYRFGIMATLDRNNTDKTVHEVESALSANLNVAEYAGLAEMADALLTNNTADALIFNSAYLDVLNEMEGYIDVADQLRQVHVETVETKIERPASEDASWKDLLTSDEEKVESNAFAMYISGIDSRSGLIAMSRSDVNILAVINPDTHQILLVSTPRDYYVPLPISNGIPDKLTHAGIYGVDVSIGTLEMIYDMDIDYYFRVNFSGFERIIDALGGISVNSPASFTSSVGKYYISEGENHLNGAQALAFARERYAFSEGDRQRGNNQMEVIKAVIRKAISPALLTNYTAIMESVAGSFETSMPYEKIAELVRDQLTTGGSWNIVSYSVNGYNDNQIPYSMSSYAYVMVPDQSTVDTAKVKIQQVINGEILE